MVPGNAWGVLETGGSQDHKKYGPHGFVHLFRHPLTGVGRRVGPTWRQMAAQTYQNGNQNQSHIDPQIDTQIDADKNVDEEFKTCPTMSQKAIPKSI